MAHFRRPTRIRVTVPHIRSEDGAMNRIPHRVALTCVVAAALASGCTTHSSANPPEWGPTATTTVAPDRAIQLATRYRQGGGLEEVHAIQRKPGSGGSPLLVVWTSNPDTGDQHFEKLKASIVGFLRVQEEIPLDEGYWMDVFGPEGELLHRLDARP
ncbi:hypothetical protein N566_27040 [Streptomycetaceae bacterium MP113-05]|nr:hypothetical protein N566_27040 [Streptomycetaceae bacterium MP113-05]